MCPEILIRILNEEGKLTKKNLFQMVLALQFKNKELLNQDGDLFLTVDSLITLNNFVTDSHNTQLRCINVKPAFYDKEYMDFTKIEPELYLLVDKFNERQISTRTFCDVFLDKIHPFSDGNGRTCKILFEDRYKLLSDFQNVTQS